MTEEVPQKINYYWHANISVTNKDMPLAIGGRQLDFLEKGDNIFYLHGRGGVHIFYDNGKEIRTGSSFAQAIYLGKEKDSHKIQLLVPYRYVYSEFNINGEEFIKAGEVIEAYPNEIFLDRNQIIPVERLKEYFKREKINLRGGDLEKLMETKTMIKAGETQDFEMILWRGCV